MTDIVTVLCKLPQGITIDIGVPGQKGYAWVHVPGPSKGNAGRARVPKTMWEDWLRRYGELRFVKKGFVRLA